MAIADARYRFFILTFFVFAIPACSGRGQLEQDPQLQRLWGERQTVLAQFRQWDMYARAALQLEGAAYNTGIRWKREFDGRFMMMLEAPFGQGVFRIDATPAGAYHLLLPDGRVFVNSSAEALLENAVGWSLPIGGLDYWIRGMPYPNSDHRDQLDTDGRARSIRQDGWDIEYRDYFPAGDVPALPRRLTLAKDTVTLKLAIERWRSLAMDADNGELFPVFD